MTRLQHGPRFECRSQFGPEIASRPFQHGRVGKSGNKTGTRRTGPVALNKSGVATGTPSAITAARLFGLDAGDWSMILFGVALAALLLALV